MASVSAILHSLGIRMCRYLDDWLVQSSSQESLLGDLLTVLRLCHELGIVFNPKQSDLIPSQVVQYLWVVIDSTSFRASPSMGRISRLRSTAVCISVMRLAYRELVAVASRHSFLAGSPRSWRLTEGAVPPALPPSFLGQSGSGGSSVSVDDVSSRSPVVAPSTSSVSRGVSPPGVSWPPLFVRRLGRGMGRPSPLSGRFRPVGPPADSVVYQRQGTARCSAGAFPVPVIYQRSHSGCLLRQHHSGDLPSQGGWHQVSSPQSLGSGDLGWTESLSIRLAPQFLPGSDNVLADALSRPHQLPHTEWSLNMTVFLSLRRLWPVQIVLFATSANHRCSIYFSPFRDPRSAGTDAFLQSWDGLQASAFPPVAVIPRVLTKLRPPRGRYSLS